MAKLSGPASVTPGPSTKAQKSVGPKTVSVSEDEIVAARAVLDRERTAAISHGGLRGLLSLSTDEHAALVALLSRCCGC